MGEQHEYFCPAFHKTLKDLECQKERDEYLRDLCREENIILIEFWYNDEVKNYQNLLIKQFYDQTKELGFFQNGYLLNNIPQFTPNILHNKFLGAEEIHQKSLKDFI